MGGWRGERFWLSVRPTRLKLELLKISSGCNGVVGNCSPSGWRTILDGSWLGRVRSIGPRCSTLRLSCLGMCFVGYFVPGWLVCLLCLAVKDDLYLCEKNKINERFLFICVKIK
jgi:hypothetical protein